MLSGVQDRLGTFLLLQRLASSFQIPGGFCCCMQAQDSIAQSRPEAAQAHGRALLNLRVQDAEGGLLGRTLLTLVSNKVSFDSCRHVNILLCRTVATSCYPMQWFSEQGVSEAGRLYRPYWHCFLGVLLASASQMRAFCQHLDCIHREVAHWQASRCLPTR